jgi:hypothetical protein
MKKLLLLTIIALPMAVCAQSFTSEVTVNLNANTPPGLGSLSGQMLGEFTPADSDVGRVILDAFGTDDGIFLRRANGTNYSGMQTELVSGNTIGVLGWLGYNGSAYSSATAFISAISEESWSSTAEGTSIAFYTTAPTTTSTTAKERFWGSGGVSVGNSIVSTDPGASNLIVSGAVGIGITDPSTQFATYKLAVAGTIEAYEVVVQTGWSDYVFAKDYRLPSLSEVESCIKAEHHLPGVPSAKEVAEKGVSLGDMQSKLLAQIEQLTLHQIEQEKRLNEQSAQLREQEGQIEDLKKENSALRESKPLSP